MTNRTLLCLLFVLFLRDALAQTPNRFDLSVKLEAGNTVQRNKDLYLKVIIHNGDYRQPEYSEIHPAIRTNPDGVALINVGGGTSQGRSWSTIDWKNKSKKVRIEGKDVGTSASTPLAQMAEVAPTAAAYAQFLDLPYNSETDEDGKPAFEITNKNGSAVIGRSLTSGDAILGHLGGTSTFSSVAGHNYSPNGNAIWGAYMTKEGAVMNGGRIGDQWHSAYFWGKPVRIDAEGNTLVLAGTNSSYIEFFPTTFGGGRKGWFGFDRYPTGNWDFKMVNDAGGAIGLYAAQGVVIGGNRSLSCGTIISDGSITIAGDINSAGTINANGAALSYAAYCSWFRRGSDGDCRSGNGQRTGNFACSIVAQKDILADAFNSRSDRRIKRDIVQNKDFENAISILKKLRVCDYKYIDVINKGGKSEKGFIANEVENVFPEAISFTTDVVPDIYQIGHDVSFNEENNILAITVDSLQDLSAGEKVRIIGEKEHILEVVSVKGNVIEVKNWPETNTHEVFVYGREVSDFRVVDYPRIYTLNIIATQALIKEVDDLKQQIATLQQLNQNLVNQKDSIEKRFQQIEQQLSMLSTQLTKPASQNGSSGK